MASRLNPYLSFQGSAREAMELYRSVFGGELQIMTFGQGGMSQDPAQAEKVMHAQLEAPNGFTLMASDMPPGMELQTGTNIAVSLSGDEEAELRGYWDKLCEGGNIALPLEKAPWGDLFGMCIDRFGISWLVNISGEQPSS